jgi:hypothetical protein
MNTRATSSFDTAKATRGRFIPELSEEQQKMCKRLEHGHCRVFQPYPRDGFPRDGSRPLNWEWDRK